MKNQQVIESYLAHYAEPEIAAAGLIAQAFGHVAVLPCYNETATVLEMLDRLPIGSEGPVLVVVVLNGKDNTDLDVHATNQALFETLLQSAIKIFSLKDGSAHFSESPRAILLIDRFSAGRRIPQKEGVGRARKIGMDIALQLFARKQVVAPWIYSLDADVTLPTTYFSQPFNTVASAVTYPFVHMADPDVDPDATKTYDAYLRYYVAGLRRAGSPYAHYSIASIMAIHMTYYAHVRGMPKRAAGEDFYLLNKLAKLTPIVEMPGFPIVIQSRHIRRTPFGTAYGVQNITDLYQKGEDYQVVHPEVFDVLAIWLFYLKNLAEDIVPPPLSQQLKRALDTLNVWSPIEKIVRQTPEGKTRALHLMQWFDGLQSLRLIHVLRDQGMGTVAFDNHVIEKFGPAAVQRSERPGA